MVSVIVISHNYSRFLLKCVKSILSNKKKYLKEIIIIDDSSDDDTYKISKLLSKKYKKIKVYKKYFKSLAKSSNYGIKKSAAEWVCKIDADDFVSKNFLKDFVEEINLKKLDFVYGNLVELSGNKRKIIRQNYGMNNIFKYPMGSGTIFKKKLWKKISGFDEKIYYQDDFDFWLRIKKEKKFKKGYLDKANYFYRKHNKNMSRSVLKKNLTKLFVLFKNLI